MTTTVARAHNTPQATAQAALTAETATASTLKKEVDVEKLVAKALETQIVRVRALFLQDVACPAG